MSVSLSYFCRFNISIGLVWANGEHWKKVRRFALHSMRDLGVGKKSIEEVIQDEAKTLTNIFSSKENQPITDVKRMMTTSISNVIHHVVFGFRCVCKVMQLESKSINLQLFTMYLFLRFWLKFCFSIKMKVHVHISIQSHK